MKINIVYLAEVYFGQILTNDEYTWLIQTLIGIKI